MYPCRSAPRFTADGCALFPVRSDRCLLRAVARWTAKQRLAAAIRLLHDDHLDALIVPPICFGELPRRLSEILAPGSDVLCQLIEYN